MKCQGINFITPKTPSQGKVFFISIIRMVINLSTIPGSNANNFAADSDLIATRKFLLMFRSETIPFG